MTKLEMADAIAKAVEHVPVPMVAAIATGVDAVLSLIETERGISLAEERGFAQELATAKEPWQQIHDRATGIASAADLGSHAAPTGD